MEGGYYYLTDGKFEELWVGKPTQLNFFMPKPINVLVVEDSENDTELLLRELQRNGYAPRHCRVDTAEALRAAIEQHPWDVVVSDYGMPQFSGAEALKVFTEFKRDCPFIFVSGTLSEDAAVRIVKNGAADFIMKGNLHRFVPALERELESARSRYAGRTAEMATQHLAAIVSSSNDAIYTCNPDSFITSWNPAAEQLFGYSAEEIIGRSFAVLFPLSRRDELLHSMTHIRRGELVALCDTERLHKDGRILPVSTSISPVQNKKGEYLGASVIDRDIAYQRKQERIHLQLIAELTEALRQSQTLDDDLRICAACKRVHNEDGNWLQVENYLALKSNSFISHDICPTCDLKYANQTESESSPVLPAKENLPA